MLDTWEQFLATFAGEESTFAWCHWDGTAATEAAIKAETKATIRCIPLPGQGPAPEPGTCIKSGAPSKQRVLIAKSY
jgi:prolyl-tRNA synthetase